MNVNKSKPAQLSMHFFIGAFLQSEKNFILQQARMGGSLHFIVLVLDNAVLELAN